MNTQNNTLSNNTDLLCTYLDFLTNTTAYFNSERAINKCNELTSFIDQCKLNKSDTVHYKQRSIIGVFISVKDFEIVKDFLYNFQTLLTDKASEREIQNYCEGISVLTFEDADFKTYVMLEKEYSRLFTRNKFIKKGIESYFYKAMINRITRIFSEYFNERFDDNDIANILDVSLTDKNDYYKWMNIIRAFHVYLFIKNFGYNKEYHSSYQMKDLNSLFRKMLPLSVLFFAYFGLILTREYIHLLSTNWRAIRVPGVIIWVIISASLIVPLLTSLIKQQKKGNKGISDFYKSYLRDAAYKYVAFRYLFLDALVFNSFPDKKDVKLCLQIFNNLSIIEPADRYIRIEYVIHRSFVAIEKYIKNIAILKIKEMYFEKAISLYYSEETQAFLNDFENDHTDKCQIVYQYCMCFIASFSNYEDITSIVVKRFFENQEKYMNVVYNTLDAFSQIDSEAAHNVAVDICFEIHRIQQLVFKSKGNYKQKLDYKYNCYKYNSYIFSLFEESDNLCYIRALSFKCLIDDGCINDLYLHYDIDIDIDYELKEIIQDIKSLIDLCSEAHYDDALLIYEVYYDILMIINGYIVEQGILPEFDIANEILEIEKKYPDIHEKKHESNDGKNNNS